MVAPRLGYSDPYHYRRRRLERRRSELVARRLAGETWRQLAAWFHEVEGLVLDPAVVRRAVCPHLPPGGKPDAAAP